MPGDAHLQQTGVMSRGILALTVIFREDLVDTEVLLFSCFPTSPINLPLSHGHFWALNTCLFHYSELHVKRPHPTSEILLQMDDDSV